MWNSRDTVLYCRTLVVLYCEVLLDYGLYFTVSV